MAETSDYQLRSPSLSDQARDRLRAAIIEGKLKPGEKINIERVAEMFGISRTPIREALKALETEGLVQIKTNRGAIVEPQAWQEIHHRFRMRSLLECYAAQLACEKKDPKLIAALRENCEQAKKAGQALKPVSLEKARKIAGLNRQFHRAIWAGSGSQTLVRFLEVLDLPQSFDEAFYKPKSSRDLVSQHHEAIVEAFVDGDPPRAKSLMEQHILASENLLESQAGGNVGNLCC
ncbi:MAG TPA: GntR family transcriptional regulator [Allosphingosinicella sp.]|nr:GntR family transcriptional regulator [Allosphingosinicella sp.]